MGCSVIAVDVSRNALDVGQAIAEKDPIAGQFSLEFLPYDGEVIALPDGSIDRIVCLDCFHHVHDQEATLKEFFRLLRPGGIVGFSEPGPNHSKLPNSQYEMRTFGVIENDIDVAWIANVARAIGFDEPVLNYATSPKLMGLLEFDAITSGDADANQAKQLLDSDAGFHENYRCFYLTKPGAPRVPSDSRTRAGLACSLTVELTGHTDSEVFGVAHIKNTGGASWLTAGAPIGTVNIGLHLSDADGQPIDFDYGRIAILQPLAPMEEARIEFTLKNPGQALVLEFDAVSEGVAWFATLGSVPVRVQIP